jgi:hypothetical protein
VNTLESTSFNGFWPNLVQYIALMRRCKNLNPWPLTLKINRVPDSPNDYVCTQFGQNPLKDVDSNILVNTLESTSFNGFWPNLVQYIALMRVETYWFSRSKVKGSDTQFGQNPLKDVDSRVFTRMLRGNNLIRWHWPLTLKINRVPDSPKE